MKSNLANKQQGAVLLVTLIIMTALLISGLAMLGTTKSASIIAGNMSFRQGGTSVSDVGIYSALTQLNGITNKEVTTPNLYYAHQQPIDSNGIPTTVDWSNVPSTVVQNYNVQTVIERLCTGVLPVSDFATQCNTGVSGNISSNKSGAPPYLNPAIYYRVTVHTTGPKNSTSWVQAILVQD